MELTVKLIFAGLLAFAPDDRPAGPNPDLLVLFPLTNGGKKSEASDACGFPEHHPRLIVEAEVCEEIVDEKPSPCVTTFAASGTSASTASQQLPPDFQSLLVSSFPFDLTDYDVNLEPRPGSPWNLKGGRGTGLDGKRAELPASSTESEDSSWLPRAKVSGQSLHIHPRYQADVPLPKDRLAARVTVGPGELRTCMLAENMYEQRVVTYDFRPYKGTKDSRDPQTLAEAVEITHTIAPTDGALTLRLTPFGGGTPRVFRLRSSTDIRLLFLHEGGPHLGHCDETQVGRHFELYYALAQTPPNCPGDCPLPHALPAGQWKKSKNVQPFCRLPPLPSRIGLYTINRPPICPPIAFGM